MSEGVVGRNEILSLQFCVDIFLLSLTAKRSCNVALCQWKMSFPLEEDSENKKKKGILLGYLKLTQTTMALMRKVGMMIIV